MPAELLNPSGVEVTYRFLWQGEICYGMNLYVPDDINFVPTPADVVQDWYDQLFNVGLLTIIHEDCIFLDVKGRGRGEAAGQVYTLDLGVPGNAVGLKTPNYLTYSWLQHPNNATRLEVGGSFSPLRDGRFSFPGVTQGLFDGTNVIGVATTVAAAVSGAMLEVQDVSNPGISHFLVQTRHSSTGVLQVKANLIDIQFNGIGTQLTRKNDI